MSYFPEQNDFELHYYFDDESHEMNALIQNKCEFEFLNILKELSLILDFELIINTEPLSEGGIRRWYSLIKKEEYKKATISISVVSAFLTMVLVTPVSTAITKSVEIAIERAFETELDKENKILDNEEKKLRILKLKLEIQEKINNNQKINKRKSNFYFELSKEPKVNQISFSVEDKQKGLKLIDEQFVEKSNFGNFILQSDKLENEPISSAYIEIISPVLKKGSYKWKGIYNDKTISFSMKSTEFKKMVLNGDIEFKNGSAILCDIEVEKELNNEGDEIITSINVLKVLSFIENGAMKETPEGKLHRGRKEADKNQYKLF